jgi:hypothetical protein
VRDRTGAQRPAWRIPHRSCELQGHPYRGEPGVGATVQCRLWRRRGRCGEV